MTYSISHTNKDGKTGVAACHITAKNLTKAVRKFEKMFPERLMSTWGILGEESPR